MLAWQICPHSQESEAAEGSVCQVPGHEFSRKQHLPSAMVNSQNILLSPPFSFGGIEEVWVGKLGWTGEEPQRCFSVEQMRSLYHILSLV